MNGSILEYSSLSMPYTSISCSLQKKPPKRFLYLTIREAYVLPIPGIFFHWVVSFSFKLIVSPSFNLIIRGKCAGLLLFDAIDISFLYCNASDLISDVSVTGFLFDLNDFP